MTNKENSMKTKQMFFILLLDVDYNNLKFKKNKQARREKNRKQKVAALWCAYSKRVFDRKDIVNIITELPFCQIWYLIN